MRKGRGAKKRELLADTKFNNKLVAKFINMVMFEGKKAIAERIVYGAFEIVKKQLNEPDALKIFHKAVDNVRPRLEVKPRRVGGATYQVPIEVPLHRSTSLAVRWLVRNARERSGKSMEEKLAAEIIDAVNNRGGAVKKKEDTHKMAEANRAFAHYRW